MNKEPIKLTEYSDELFKNMVAAIIEEHPVKNLTEEEVQTTLRLFELQMLLGNKQFESRPVDIWKNDARLVNVSDEDKFLAMLLEYDQQDLILCSGNCIYRFGGTKYHWRKIGRTCPITTTASALSESGDGGYYGKGWIIAPHIKTLMKWMNNHPNKIMLLCDEAMVKIIKGESV